MEESRKDATAQVRGPGRRFIYIAIAVIVVAVFWGIRSHQEKSDIESRRVDLARLRDLAVAASAPDKVERLDELIGKYSQSEDELIQAGVAWARIERARSLPGTDPTRAAAIDEVLRLYSGKPGETESRGVAWALAAKAADLADGPERDALLDRLVGEFAGVDDDEVRRLVAFALDSRAASAADGREKRRLYERVVDAYAARSDPFLRSRVARALAGLAELASAPEERVRLYERIVENYRIGADPELQDIVFSAYRNLAGALDGPEERAEFYNRELTRHGEALPAPMRIFLLNARGDSLGGKEANAADEEILRLFGTSEDPFARLAVMRIYRSRALASRSRSERARLLDLALERAREDDGRQARLLAVELLYELAEAGADREAKLGVYDRIVSRYGEDPDSRVWLMTWRAFAARAGLGGDDAAYSAFLDRVVGSVPGEAARALFAKARLIEDPAGKAALYDEIIAGNGGRELGGSSMEYVRDAYMAKAALMPDAEGRVAVYDELLAVLPKPGNPDSLADNYPIISALAAKADASGDDAELMALFDRLVARQSDPGRAAEIMLEQAELARTPAKKRLLYGMIAGDEEKYGSVPVDKAQLGMARSLEAEAAALYDRVAERSRGREDHTRFALVDAYKGKIRLAKTNRDKVRLYQEMIGTLGTDLNYWYVNSVLDMIELVPSSADRLRVYDRILGDMAGRNDQRALYATVKVLSAKAEFLGGDERVALYEHVVAAYRDNVDPDISRLVDEAARRLEALSAPAPE